MEQPEDNETTSPIDSKRPSVLFEILQVLLGATGIFAAAFYAVGWLYWLGYFGYFEVPLGAVDLGVVDMAAGAFPRFLPVIGVLALAPLMILWDRSVRRRAARVLAENVALLDLADDLDRHAGEAATTAGELLKEVEAAQGGVIDDLDRRVKEAEVRRETILKDADALKALVSDVDSLIPMSWVLPLIKKMRWQWTVIFAIGAIAFVGGVTFLISYLDDGLRSASLSPIRTMMAGILAVLSIALAFHMWERRFTAVTVLLVVTLLVGLPVSAWVDGRVSASVDWNSSERADHFEQVVLYSELQLFDEWEQTEGALFASPELLLIKETGDSYVVAADGSSDKVTVISSNIITHVDYFR